MSDLLAALDSLRERLKEIPQADERRLQELKTELLGRKAGALTEILKALPGLEAEERKRVGGAANALKRELEHAIEVRESDLKRSATTLEGIDLTMPGRRQWRGGLRPVPPHGGRDWDILQKVRVPPRRRPPHATARRDLSPPYLPT